MMKLILGMSIFMIIMLFSGSISPSLLIQESNAMISKGTMLSAVHSDKVCGDQLCSVMKATPPKGQIVIPENEKQEDNPDASMLFVQTAGSGTFQEKDGKKILTFVDVSPTTVYFSDRPDRITGFMQTDLFVAVWGEGEDSFADDPPNAALELLDWDDQPVVFIIELLNVTYNPEEEILQYEVKILEEGTEGLSHYNKYNEFKIPATFEDSVLFIDSAFGDWFKNAGKVMVDGTKIGAKYLKENTLDPITGKVTTLITPIVSSGVSLLCTVGSEIDGRVGCAIGTELAMESVGTFLGAVTMTDIGTALDPDMAWLAKAVQTALTSPTSNSAVTLALTYNIFAEQGENIEDDFMTFMHGFRDNPAMTTAYDADNFCGMPNDDYFENVLYPFFIYNLQHELYYTIFDDLENGMTLSEVQTDIDENLEEKASLVLIYSLVHIRDICVDEDSDLYSLIYASIDSTYKVDLVASSNSDGETSIENIFPTAAELTAKEAKSAAAERRLYENQDYGDYGDHGDSKKPLESGLASLIKQAAKEDAETVARTQAYANLEAQLVSEEASFGIDESSIVSEVPVFNDPVIDAGFNEAVSDIESSVSSEASSQIESFTENSESYMEDFEVDLINFNEDGDFMLDDVVGETITDVIEGEVSGELEGAVEDAVEGVAEEVIEGAVEETAAP